MRIVDGVGYVLEEAGLIHTRRVGRSTHHHLDPAPSRASARRWPSDRRVADAGPEEGP